MLYLLVYNERAFFFLINFFPLNDSVLVLLTEYLY